MTIDISKHISKSAATFYINGKNQYKVIKESGTLYKKSDGTTTYYKRDDTRVVYSKGTTRSVIGYVTSLKADGTVGTWVHFVDGPVTIHYNVNSETIYTYKSVNVSNYSALQAADYAYIPEEIKVTTNTITFDGASSSQGDTIDLGTH